MDRIPHEDREKWDRDLLAPLPDQSGTNRHRNPTKAELDADRDSFMATFNQTQR